jgi:hypothetical protein
VRYSIFGIGVDRSHNCRADFPQAGVKVGAPGARSLRAGGDRKSALVAAGEFTLFPKLP